MRIAILSCFYPYRGGIAQFNAALYDELGRTCEVKAFNFSRQYPEVLFPGKTQYVSADDEAMAVESTPVLDSCCPLSYIRTYRAIKAWKPDLVVVRYWMSFFGPSLGYVTRRLRRDGIKVISILDNVVPHEGHFFDKPFTSYFLKGSDRCITLCDAVADDLKKFDADKPCKVIPHPLYSHFGQKLDRKQALEALGLDPSRKTLLFFGLIREYKGLDVLLEAFGMLDESYQLIVAGEPYGSFEKYQAIIDTLPGRDRISLNLHYIKDSQVRDYFSGSDLCVLPYRSATQSGVGAVAFHFEVPMLVTDTGGLKETIADTGCGLMASKADPVLIKEQIERYFADPAIKESCIGGIRVQKEKLSWKSFAAQLIEEYHKA